MAENYYDKQIIPLKVRNSEAESMSLDTGYYIEGRLETFSKEQYFDDLLSIYIPESFIDMPKEIREMKYPTNFRPEIIKTNLAGDVNLSISLLKVGEDTEVKTLVTDFKSLLSKAHTGIKFLEYDELEKEGCVKMYYFLANLETLENPGKSRRRMASAALMVPARQSFSTASKLLRSIGLRPVYFPCALAMAMPSR